MSLLNHIHHNFDPKKYLSAIIFFHIVSDKNIVLVSQYEGLFFKLFESDAKLCNKYHCDIKNDALELVEYVTLKNETLYDEVSLLKYNRYGIETLKTLLLCFEKIYSKMIPNPEKNIYKFYNDEIIKIVLQQNAVDIFQNISTKKFFEIFYNIELQLNIEEYKFDLIEKFKNYISKTYVQIGGEKSYRQIWSRTKNKIHNTQKYYKYLKQLMY